MTKKQLKKRIAKLENYLEMRDKNICSKMKNGFEWLADHLRLSQEERDAFEKAQDPMEYILKAAIAEMYNQSPGTLLERNAKRNNVGATISDWISPSTTNDTEEPS